MRSNLSNVTSMAADDKGQIDPENTPKISFKDIGLGPKIIKALDDKGYEFPTPIQAGAIPHALNGKDVLGIAQTGTGKTGAFTLPILHLLARGRARARMPRCLVICPTRELAAQVAENVESYGKYLKLEMALLIGGVSFAEQDRKLARGVDILIATPGRLLDQFERGKILLTGVQALVVDEADRMLDMGFIPDIEKIFKLTPFTRQVLFFSATMPPEITRLVETFLHQPERVEVARQATTAETVTQHVITMPSNDFKAKRNALRGAIRHMNVKNGIVFCNRKSNVDIVANSLNKHGHKSAPIHGDLPQSVRTQTLQQFRDGELQLLVASDVAARGLDVPDVGHVFNFSVPVHAEDYVHRIGRTGRAGREGDAVMIVTPSDKKAYEAVLDLIKSEPLPELELDGVSLEAIEENRRGHRSTGRGRDRDRQSNRRRSSQRDDRRDRPVKDHGQVADMSPVSTAPKSANAKPKTTAKSKSSSKKTERPRKSKTETASSQGQSSFGENVPAFLRQTIS